MTFLVAISRVSAHVQRPLSAFAFESMPGHSLAVRVRVRVRVWMSVPTNASYSQLSVLFPDAGVILRDATHLFWWTEMNETRAKGKREDGCCRLQAV